MILNMKGEIFFLNHIKFRSLTGTPLMISFRVDISEETSLYVICECPDVINI
jgi:hypothetical protein